MGESEPFSVSWKLVARSCFFLLDQFAWAAETKYHRQSGLNHGNVFTHSFGRWESMIKGSAGLVFSEVAPSLPLHNGLFSVHIHL